MKPFTLENKAGFLRGRAIGWIFAGLLATPSFAQEQTSFPEARSKKGLQVQMIDDALTLGIDHAALNCNLTALHEFKARPDDVAWKFDGADYFFNARAVAALDAMIKPLSEAGVVVYLILLAYESGEPARDTIALHPAYDRAAQTNRLGAFNTVTAEGLRHFRAVIDFLAHRYSSARAEHGRVWGYIVGNEVNSHWWWYNLGRASAETVSQEYERAVRLVWNGVRRASAHARVYLSLEHHWAVRYSPGDEKQALPGRDLLERFAARAKELGDFDWHVAFHPYPENLGRPDFWNDKTALRSFETPRITFRNLELLPTYLARDELRHHGKPRRLILSEQGFHSDSSASGQTAQAAAFAAAWWKVARLEGIDAFIYHRHVDHAAEGLNFGLWSRAPGSISRPAERKPIYEVFRAADTAGWEEAFAFALPIVGVARWDEFWPGSAKRE